MTIPERIAPVAARDVIQTLALLFAAGLLAELAASALRVPRIVALLAAGAAFGPNALGLLELPPGSLGGELLLTLGVSFILFHGGAELSLPVLRSVALGLGLLAVPGVLVSALVTGAVAALAFDIPFTAGLLSERSWLRPTRQF